MKRCPYCAEQIQDEAVACRFCGRSLTERSVAGSGARRFLGPPAVALGGFSAAIAAVSLPWLTLGSPLLGSVGIGLDPPFGGLDLAGEPRYAWTGLALPLAAVIVVAGIVLWARTGDSMILRVAAGLASVAIIVLVIVAYLLLRAEVRSADLGPQTVTLALGGWLIFAGGSAALMGALASQ